MIDQSKIAGVVLAGGLARRMSHQDKGLILYRGKPLVSYALQTLLAVSDEVLISANRNMADYRQWQLPVITDGNDRFEGPLAGILSALQAVDADILLVMPCDSPLFSADHARRLLTQLDQNGEVVVASDGDRLQPVFMALRTTLKEDLQAYLQGGGRKIQDWLKRQATAVADFSDQPQIFSNINTPEELLKLESQTGQAPV